MADFFRFLRQSSTRFFSSNRTKSSTQENQSMEPMECDEDNNADNKMTNYELMRCIHVNDTKWDDLNSELEDKYSTRTGLVFINPSFSRTYYVPISSFRCEYDEFSEYTGINHEMLAFMKNDHYDKWMQAMIRTDSSYISIHCCQAAELLNRFCVRCSKLTRLSFHYYHLDEHFVTYIVDKLPNVLSINLENSIGLSTKAYTYLGQLNRLAHLNLSGCDIYESSLDQVLEHCQHLESLNVSNNCALTGHCLAHRTIKNLKRLNIRDCWRITSVRLMEMAQNGLPNLIELLCNSGVNDDSLEMIGNNCSNLLHLDISFEEFTYFDEAGFNLLTDKGFVSISKLVSLKVLRLRHIGRLTDIALSTIIRSCYNLNQLTLNLRHRHKLTDRFAMEEVARYCPNLMYFEAVHNHFISRYCIGELARLMSSLQMLILRGDELVQDDDICQLIDNCVCLRVINLDGCRDIGTKTLTTCVTHTRNIQPDSNGHKHNFHASLICTSVERTLLNSLVTDLPENLRIRASDHRRNKEHFNEFDGQTVIEHKLRETFFPFFWYDYN